MNKATTLVSYLGMERKAAYLPTLSIYVIMPARLTRNIALKAPVLKSVWKSREINFQL